jgi:hypothetical protein
MFKLAYSYGLRFNELRHLQTVDSPANGHAGEFGDYGVAQVRYGKAKKGSTTQAARRPVLDRARPPPRRPHDLHGGRSSGGLDGAHIGHQRSLRPELSAQISPAQPQTSRSNRCNYTRPAEREPSQVHQGRNQQSVSHSAIPSELIRHTKSEVSPAQLPT